MKTTRLEAFSDGVLAIIITIMVLELKVPHAVEFAVCRFLPELRADGERPVSRFDPPVGTRQSAYDYRRPE